MISVNFSIHLSEPDALVVARNAIFRAMFERAADQLEQDVFSDGDDTYTDVHVDNLSADLAAQFFDLLDQVNLLDHIVADVSTTDELGALSRFSGKVAMELV
jgi:hypothetical protein